MMDLTDAPRAWGYTRGAARVIGINLTDAVLDGWLSREELARIVQICDGCGQTAPCTDWLAQIVKADHLPGYCPNKSSIEVLKP